MSPTVPTLNPDAAAAILESATPRIDRKATSLLETQADWVIEGDVVAIGSARVSVVDGSATCDCLLAPKCAHLLAVARVAPVADGDAVEEQAAESVGQPTEPELISASLTAVQRSAVDVASAALESILRSGLREITTVARGSVLRAVHACRVTGLHKLGAEVMALHSVLAEQADRDVDALSDALLAVFALRQADTTETVGPEVIGVARRAFEIVGTLRLFGLACEPIITDSGYAGVTTYFVDADGAGYELSSVLPGGADGVTAAYRRPGGLGEYPASPAELARSGVLIAGATVSAEGRLGRGKSVRARTLADAAQAQRWSGKLPTGWRRVDGAVRADESGVVVDGCALRWSAGAVRLGEIAPPFADGDDAAVLACGGVVLAVEYLAADGDRKVWMPGLDHPIAARRVAEVGDVLDQDDFPADERGPSAVLRRWVIRVARHGVGVLERDRAAVTSDAAWLAAHGSPYRSELLSALAAAGDELPKAWLRASVASAAK